MLELRAAPANASDLPKRDALSIATDNAVRERLAGRRRGLLAWLPMAGPAVIVSVAYVDPGNFATNIQAGARYGYALLWVVVLANLVAMLFQSLSARLGIVTNRNLAELCREHFPRPVVIAMWVVSEIGAMATDLAEFLGGAIGVSLLLHLPLLTGMVVVGVITYAILMMERSGYRKLEFTIGALVIAIAVCYLIELFIAPLNWPQAALHAVVPTLPDGGAVLLAAGILGATVMPHAIFLHSGLTQNRAPARNMTERRQLVRFSNREVIVTLTLAGLVNGAMILMAASAFHAGHAEMAEISEAYRTLGPLLGAPAAAIFLISLLASGVSSSVVGTLAGQVVLQGFTGWRIPIWVRRLVTMVPAFLVVAAGVGSTRSLVISQVVLSFVLPVPMIALVVLSRRRDLMGEMTIGPGLVWLASLAAAATIGLNILLLAKA